MKTRIGIYLDADVACSFKIALRQPGATKSKLVNAALRTYLSPPPEPEPGDQVLRHLKGLAKRLRQLHRETEVVSETLALFVRYFLMITPPIQENDRLRRLLGVSATLYSSRRSPSVWPPIRGWSPTSYAPL